ncbi:F-box only protein 44-like [Zootoca vivipara]|uniref:F-box only protein 44-like n=1 Tax=Zootoca vivipara TaxID=8524 RepID=UPI00293C0D07|nr:F-box only protein 44-like [Zootoca vivipara]
MAANIENLPENLLLDIFIMVPACDLICNCRLVCSQWRDLVDLPVLWKRKFQKRDHDSSPQPLAFYIFSRLKKNLIRNPDGQGMSPFIWENRDALDRAPCKPSSPPPSPPTPTPSCSKSQLITLKDEGYWDELMDQARPLIVVKDFFSRKPGSHYKLTVKLLSADSEVLEEYQYEEAGVSYWFLVSHAFHNYPQGVRHILFEHKRQEKAYSRLLNFLFPEQGPSEDRQPFRGGMRVLQSSITLHPPPMPDDNCYLDPPEHSSSD